MNILAFTEEAVHLWVGPVYLKIRVRTVLLFPKLEIRPMFYIKGTKCDPY